MEGDVSRISQEVDLKPVGEERAQGQKCGWRVPTTAPGTEEGAYLSSPASACPCTVRLQPGARPPAQKASNCRESTGNRAPWAAASTPLQGCCLFRAARSHPAHGLHLDVVLGGVVQKPYPHSSSTWGLKRRHRCSLGSPGDLLDAPTLSSPVHETARTHTAADLTYLQCHCPQSLGRTRPLGI